jgi:hypothetical protein
LLTAVPPARVLRTVALSLVLLGCTGDAGLPGEPVPPDTATWTPTATTHTWPDEAGAPIPVPDDLAGLDWLTDVSHYGADGVYEGRDASGTFGLGNGIVFGLLGLDSPWNTLTNAIGPGYQRDVGFFGDSSLLLVRDGMELEVQAEQVQRPRRTAVVRTGARSGELGWTTSDVALVGEPVIARHVTVVNDGSVTAADLVMRLTVAVADEDGSLADGDGLVQVRGERQMRVDCPGETLEAGESWLDVAVPALGPGEQVSFVCLHRFSDDTVFDDPDGDVTDWLEASRAETTAFLDRAVQLDLPDPKVEDLVEGMLITELVQTSELGVVSPMHRYTSGWLRDSEGPVRLYLLAGLHEEVRGMLDAVYQVMVVSQAISNSFSLATDLSGFEEPGDPAAFWEQASFMSGRAAAEAPSYAVLLHDMYVRSSGDEEVLDTDRMAFLEACVRRQELSDGDLLPFSGDETFRFSLATAMGTDMPEEVSWSANSSFLYAAAADRLAELGAAEDIAGLGQRVREAAEAAYWVDDGGYYSPVSYFDDGAVHSAPFEDVSTQPLWSGYATADDPHQQDNIEAIVEQLMRDDGTLLSHLSGTDQDNWGYTGMVPGFFLRNMALVQHPDLERAFDGVDVVATPSGHFEEGHRPDHGAFHLSHQPDGLGTDSLSRYRPWEGGDVAAAVLAYLVGAEVDVRADSLRLAPHLPHGWPSLDAGNLRLGEERYALRVEAYDEGMVVRVQRSGPGDGAWDLAVELAGAREIAEVWSDGEALDAEPGRVVRIQGLEMGAADVELIAVYGEGEP